MGWCGIRRRSVCARAALSEVAVALASGAPTRPAKRPATLPAQRCWGGTASGANSRYVVAPGNSVAQYLIRDFAARRPHTLSPTHSALAAMLTISATSAVLKMKDTMAWAVVV